MADESSAAQRLPVSIEDELKTSYLDYSMSVIIGRALPDVRDGLKPVHRRVLFAMHQAGNTADRPYRKSAKTVGEVIGKYHPHGDQAVYDTIVRLAQPFSMRYPLVDGQGNFGSIDGDPPAAMRYTEIRLGLVAQELLRDIDKQTVDFGPNYDNTEEEPLVLPCAIPNLLANGADGIAVGMATRIPPHNLRELVDAAEHLVKDPGCTVADLMAYIQGPDFPTAGVIYGRSGIREAYRTGRGRIVVRGKVEFEEGLRGARDRLVVTEIPFQVNKTQLIEEIASLVHEKKIDGIADLRDESDREGIRVVIELRRDTDWRVVRNNLFKHTRLQSTFGAIFLAIVSGRPRVLDLKSMLSHYIRHRREVVVRRTQYLLRQAEARAHILEGLKKAIDHLDEVIALIRAAANPQVAKSELIARFEFSEIQAQAILDMRLQRLTQLEREKLVEELAELLGQIERYRQILGSTQLVDQIVVDELREIREKYGDERRTMIVDEEVEIGTLDTIAEEKVVITLSHRNYIKRTALAEYRSQGRGGQGIRLMEVGEEDFIERVRIATTHDQSLWFTSEGRVHILPVYALPDVSRAARGKAIVNLLGLKAGEKIQGVLVLRDLNEPERYIVTMTRNGVVKKTDLSAYANIRTGGLIALTLDQGDSLIAVHLVGPGDDMFLATRNGMAIRFPAAEVRAMGRTARGVRGIDLREDDEVISGLVPAKGEDILAITALGYGKRTQLEEYRPQGRGGLGLINLKISPKTGPVVAAIPVLPEDEVVVATRQGMVIRTPVEQDENNRISRLGRATQGVRVIRLKEDDEVVSVTRSGPVQAEVAGGEIADGPDGADNPENGGPPAAE
ncbi:MAG: DNA gyrase subunit A [Acidobacteria bacterium]|nr:DNA gyrase subunit A [Acidobacteriota bacterium]